MAGGNSIKQTKYEFKDILTNNYGLRQLINLGKKVSNSNSPVLIFGETGTGKELFVQAIHNYSQRRNHPFLPLNCAAIPATLIESMLFGTEKGVFTDALLKRGLLEEVEGGTLYLDELNSMPLEQQGKLLRFLEEGKIKRVGGNKDIPLNIRVIASLNEYPEVCIKNKSLREDLFYRLNVIRMNIPPLRERKEDIFLLVDYFIKRYNKVFNGVIKGIEKEVMDIILAHDWPGNVRELGNFIEGLFNLKKQGYFKIEDLKLGGSDVFLKERTSLKEQLERKEKQCINEALIITRYNISKAAEYLQIPRQTLQYKIKKYKI